MCEHPYRLRAADFQKAAGKRKTRENMEEPQCSARLGPHWDVTELTGWDGR